MGEPASVPTVHVANALGLSELSAKVKNLATKVGPGVPLLASIFLLGEAEWKAS